MKRFLFISLWLAGAAFAQHDGQRNAVIQIGEGKHDQVAKTLQKKKPNAGPAESAFVEMLNLLAQDKTAEALAKAREAVDLGLPFDRIVVGPRIQLHKLHALPEYQAWEKAQNPPVLIHGPMVGSVSDTAASFWVRTRKEAEVAIKIKGEVDAVKTTKASDFTGVVQVAGLKPSTKYEYTVLIDGKAAKTAAFTTFPASKAAFSVVFGGGAGYVPEWERMWDKILEFEPRALLMLGDNVYIDDPASELTNHYCYYRRQSRPEWRRLISQTAVYSIYDDHDFGKNDCVPGPEIENPPWKRTVWNTFRQNWVNPGYGGGDAQPGCWYDFHIGDVHFIMLDGRYYRDRDGGTMLGPVQKKWLLKTLSDSEGTFKVIASPVPFTAKIKPGSKDPWDGYPEEREEIFAHIEKEKIEGVFLICADRHRTDLRTTNRPKGYDLFEFESSRLTNHHTHSVVKTPGLIWGYNKTCSFGLMMFDTTKADPEVTFEAVDIDGNVHHSYVLKRSQLKK